MSRCPFRYPQRRAGRRFLTLVLEHPHASSRTSLEVECPTVDQAIDVAMVEKDHVKAGAWFVIMELDYRAKTGRRAMVLEKGRDGALYVVPDDVLYRDRS